MKGWKENEALAAHRNVFKRPVSNTEINMKRIFQMGWSQRGHDIYIIFTRNSAQLEFSLFDISLTDRSCSVRVPGLEKHGWNFFLEVNAKDAQRIENGDRLIIVVPKKDPTLFWTDLKKSVEKVEAKDIKLSSVASDEPPPEKIRHQAEDLSEDINTGLISDLVKEVDENKIKIDQEPNPSGSIQDPIHSTLYHHLTSVKSNWQELGHDVVVFTLFVPHLDPWGSNVTFSEERIQISFKTVDESFHSVYGTKPDVTFIWNVKLNKKIIPNKCSHKVTLKLMEIRLYKKDPIKWKNILSSKHKTDDSKESDASSNEDHFSLGDNHSLPDDNADGPTSFTKYFSSNTSSGSSVDNSQSSATKPSKFKIVGQNTGKAGYTGLDNVGNTCFLNSVVQALVNTRELRDFFLDNRYKNDINTSNPLGMGGKMAEEVADLMNTLWVKKPRSFAPIKFRRAVGEKEPRFVDYLQHDAQEFMAFLLDKLHEDLNRIKNKPCYQMPEVGDRDDRVVADESWKLHTSRNDSFIVDLFHGMFKSKLYCPVCENNSVKFDPFLFLSVPLPKVTRPLRVFFYPKDMSKSAVRVTINVSKKLGKAIEIFSQISTIFKCSINSLRIYEVYQYRIHRFLVHDSNLDKVSSNDVIYAQETLSQEEANEPVYELAVLFQQRTLPDISPSCSFCKSNPADVRIKRCTKCLRTGYCNQDCQRADWPEHRKMCRRVVDCVGSPFLVSIPKSLATCSYIKNVLWGLAKRWTSVQCFDSDEREDSPTNIEFLFFVTAVHWTGALRSDLPNLEDFGEEVLDLSQYRFLSLNWETDTRLNRFVKVYTKQQEFINLVTPSPKDTIDLYNCIKLFTEPEVLAPQEAWFCPTCREHREATKEMSLWQLPDIIIVQLKRFSFKNLLWRDKIDMMVDFPVNGLDMSPYCVHTAGDSPLIYDLFAVVNHYGGIFGGHYTTFVRLPSAEDSTKSSIGWRVCDDSHVMKISAEDVVTKAAYVMFYKKRHVSVSTSAQLTSQQLLNKPNKEDKPDESSSPDSTQATYSQIGESSSMFEPPGGNTSKEQDDVGSVPGGSTVLKSNHASDLDVEDIDDNMTRRVRKSMSDCVLGSPSSSHSPFQNDSSPLLDKPLSPLTRQVAVIDDGRNNQDISLGCIIEEPLLKYDEIFAVGGCFDNPSDTARDKPHSSGDNHESCDAMSVEQPYTDMDAVD